MRTRVATLTTAVAVLLGASLVFGQDATLRYRWVKGDVLRYRLSGHSSTTTTGLPGMGDMTLDQDMTQVMRISVDEVAADGTATLRQSIESMRMEMTSPAGKSAIDSAAKDKPSDPRAAAMQAMISAMVGEPVTVVVAPTGAVTKVEGMSRLFEKVMKTMPQDPMTAQALKEMQGSMGDDAIRSMFEQGFATFPDHAVKAGETWTGKFQIRNPAMGALTATRTSTLEGVDSTGGTAIARIATTIAVKQDEAASRSGPMGMTSKVAESKGNGEILFDVAKGRMQKTSFKSEMPVTMSMSAPDGSPITAQTLIRTTLTMDLVEK